MSQRLHIGKTKEEIYDCVIENLDGAEEKLKKDWLAMGGGFYLGPWKIKIGNKELFLDLEPLIEEIFVSLGKHYPDDVWMFYENERSIEHPTRNELDKWFCA